MNPSWTPEPKPLSIVKVLTVATFRRVLNGLLISIVWFRYVLRVGTDSIQLKYVFSLFSKNNKFCFSIFKICTKVEDDEKQKWIQSETFFRFQFVLFILCNRDTIGCHWVAIGKSNDRRLPHHVGLALFHAFVPQWTAGTCSNALWCVVSGIIITDFHIICLDLLSAFMQKKRMTLTSIQCWWVRCELGDKSLCRKENETKSIQWTWWFWNEGKAFILCVTKFLPTGWMVVQKDNTNHCMLLTATTDRPTGRPSFRPALIKPKKMEGQQKYLNWTKESWENCLSAHTIISCLLFFSHKFDEMYIRPGTRVIFFVFFYFCCWWRTRGVLKVNQCQRLFKK